MKFYKSGSVSLSCAILLLGCGGGGNEVVTTTQVPNPSATSPSASSGGSTPQSPTVAQTTSTPSPAPANASPPATSPSGPNILALPTSGFSGRAVLPDIANPSSAIAYSGEGAMFLSTDISTRRFSEQLSGGPGIGSRNIRPLNSKYVAVGNNISLSADGRNWTAGTVAPGGPSLLWDVAYGAGRYVVVGISENTQQAGALTSTDGLSWTAVSSPALRSHEWVSVSFGNGRFVAVGQDGYAATSTDGLNWTASVGAATALNNVTWSAKHSQFVAAANGRSGNNTYIGNVYVSNDGQLWSARETGYPANTNRISCDAETCVGSTTSLSPALIWSSDLVTWNRYVYPNNSNPVDYVLAINKIGTTWVVSGERGLLITSTNASNWTK